MILLMENNSFALLDVPLYCRMLCFQFKVVFELYETCTTSVHQILEGFLSHSLDYALKKKTFD